MLNTPDYARAAADYENRLPDDADDDRSTCGGCGRRRYLAGADLCARCEDGCEE